VLNNVAIAVRRSNRIVVLRHPNAIDASVLRRRVVRTAAAEGGDMGGLPTLGGIGVMDAEDEPEVEYDSLGPAKVLFTEQYQPTTMADRRDAPEAMPTAQALIEPITEGLFDIKDGDLVMLNPGAGVTIPYEVTNVINAVNIPPYAQRYELSAQGVLAFDGEIAGELASRG
jgi:hypothetical protein